jgi:hypothetical protein
MISHIMRYRYVHAIKHIEGGMEIPDEVFRAGASTKNGCLLLESKDCPYDDISTPGSIIAPFASLTIISSQGTWSNLGDNCSLILIFNLLMLSSSSQVIFVGLPSGKIMYFDTCIRISLVPEPEV